ncbi:unnamed protein product [Arctogadus glacialis]
MSTAKREEDEVPLVRACHTIDAIMKAPAAGSAANFTTPVAEDEHLDYSGELGELRGDDEDNVAHPWPYLQEIFSYVGVKDSSYRIKCLLCLTRVTEILAFKNSPVRKPR